VKVAASAGSDVRRPDGPMAQWSKGLQANVSLLFRTNGPKAQGTEKPLIHRTIGPIKTKSKYVVRLGEFRLDHWIIEPFDRWTMTIYNKKKIF
jgi:hypothetical protein